MNQTDVFNEYDEVLSDLKARELESRTSVLRAKGWQLWGWLMTMNSARLRSDVTMENLDSVIRRTPRSGFGPQQVEKLFFHGGRNGHDECIGCDRAMRHDALR